MDEMALPRGIHALWHGPETGRRGPKPTTSVEEIAGHGVALADADGLDAASLAAVAARLGLTTMSLYRYVDSRDDLRAVMVEVAMGPPPRLVRRGWRRRLDEWARADFERLRAHPWILDAHAPEPPVGPNLLGWTDAGMAVLLDAGLDPQPASSSLLAVDGLVRHNAQMLRQWDDVAAGGWASRLRSVVDPERLPALSAVLDAGALEDDDGVGTELDVGLELLLDGIAAHLVGG